MSKIQKVICVVLGIVLVGLAFSMTKPYKNIKDSLFGKSDTLTTYMMGAKTNTNVGMTDLSKTSKSVYDSTFCRTSDGVLVVMLCGHVLASDKQTVIIGAISSLKFAELKKCLSPKNKFYITNILVNKSAVDFFNSTSSLSVNSNEILVVGKVND